MTRWQVEGDLDSGLGARYSVLMKAGSAEVGGLVEVVEFDAPRDMAWTNVTGLDQRGRWRLRETDDGATTVTFRLSYQAPGGLLGSLSDRLSAPMVRQNLQQTLTNLKRRVEGGAGVGRARRRAIRRRIDQGSGPEARRCARAARRGSRPASAPGPARAPADGAEPLRRENPAAAYTGSAARYPDEPAVIDEARTVTFKELTSAPIPGARAWRTRRARG